LTKTYTWRIPYNNPAAMARVLDICDSELGRRTYYIHNQQGNSKWHIEFLREEQEWRVTVPEEWATFIRLQVG